MDYANLQVLAEVSVALLGFSGITAVVGHSRFAKQGVTYRLQGLLYSSSLAFLGSILPLIGIPLFPAAIVLAVFFTAAMAWAMAMSFGRQRVEIQPHPILVWIFVPIAMVVNVHLWWSIFVSAQRLLFAYHLQVGMLLVLGMVYFIRLVSSAFVGKEDS